MEIKVLNHGFIKLVDIMGNDSSIVQAARVSYGAGTKTLNEDRGLIRYLMRMNHTSPFEQVSFKFHLKMPIFVARQWVRHRTAKLNEVSARYSILPEEYYIPDEKYITKQSLQNKQGGNDEKIDNTSAYKAIIINHSKQSHRVYKELLKVGIRRELARIVLPLNQYTEFYWKMDLHNLFHFLKLRLDNHAQYEIQIYAKAIAEVIKSKCPTAYEAFNDYKLNSLYFSKIEIEHLKKLIDCKKIKKILGQEGLLIENKREDKEFKTKIQKLVGKK